MNWGSRLRATRERREFATAIISSAVILILWSVNTRAVESSKVLTLKEYLEQVKSGSAEARGAIEGAKAAEQKIDEADGALMPELYADYFLRDDQSEMAAPAFMGTRTKEREWKVGVRDETLFGLKADLSLHDAQTTVEGTNTAIVPQSDYNTATATLTLTQPLWRNAFGDATRGSYNAARAINRAEMLQRRMDLKNVLLKAENTYWSMVSYNQIVKLQQENVERAKALRNRLSSKARLRLNDDVDALQAEASFQSRELELLKSLDDRAAAIERFNTLRGRNSDQVENLEGLPEKEILLRSPKNQKLQYREDFLAAIELARAGAEKARADRAQIRPKLDLVGMVTSNGRDTAFSPAYEEVSKYDHPGWRVGVQFAVSLDFNLLGTLRSGFHAEERAGKQKAAFAEFSQERFWQDLVRQRSDAQARYEKALSIEKIQSDLVKRERARLNSGRSTTFQTVQFETALAGSQVQRVQSQLALIQLHNLVKQFTEEKP